jgi:mercuric ion binding protein
MKKIFITLLAILALFLYPLGALAGESASVTVSVDGLSCPFCAYGLEKKMKKMDGVTGLVIDIEAGHVEITFKDKDSVSMGKIRDAVREAGFTPRKIEVEDAGD